MDFFARVKKYVVLIRAYSIIDVLLLLLVARTLAVGGIVYGWRDVITGVIALCLWGVLTLSLEAKHRHAYREQIRYIVPGIFLAIASCLSYFFNPYSLFFIFFVCLFTNFYIKKEINWFWGMTSSFWRGMYEVVLFFACWSLYAPVRFILLRELGISFVILCFYLGRNLIADVRDVAFDRLTLVVFWGCKKSYFLALGAFCAGAIALFALLPSVPVVLPALTISFLLLIYDDGFMLHRLSIMVTSFTFVNIVLQLKGMSLLYPNLLFLGIVSNFFFYEKVARPSNPLARVPHQVRFLFASTKSHYPLVSKRP